MGYSIYLAEDYMVIHPLKKRCFKLPLIKRLLNWAYVSRYESSGLGFDASTNTFKVVCVCSRRQPDPQVKFDQINKDLITMVHVLGTNSWREIPTVPAYPINGKSVFAHGRLHWLVTSRFVFQQIYIYHDKPSEDRLEVISFDVTTEEFGLINPSKATITSDRMLYYQLVDLHGEVGYLHSYFDDRIELWVLKETEWAIYCCFDRKPPLPKDLSVKVLGHWNKDRDLLISSDINHQQQLFIYSLKNCRLHSVSIVGEGDIYAYNKDDIYMYPSCGVFSIRGTKKNAYSITN